MKLPVPPLLKVKVSTESSPNIKLLFESPKYIPQSLDAVYQEKLREARFVDASEGTPYDVDASTFINARY